MLEDLGCCLGGCLSQGLRLTAHLLQRLRHRINFFCKFYCGETMQCFGHNICVSEDFLTEKTFWQSFNVVLTILAVFAAVICAQLTGRL